MITQVSCKLTNALITHAEKQGISLSSLFEYFDGPEEFLRDPHFWIDMGQCEKLYVRASRLMGDPTLGTSVAAQLLELGAFGALDNVFKMMPSRGDYFANLSRFFSYFLAPITEFKEHNHGENHVRFKFPFSAGDYAHIFAFLKTVLENLPRYTGHLPAHIDFSYESNDMLISWDTAQPSLFLEEPGHVLNPRLVQTLSSQLEASERALHAKSREVMNLRSEMETLRNELQVQLRERVYTEKMSGLAQLAAGVAHEINNPLSFVTSNLKRFEDYFLRLQLYIQSLERNAGAAEPALELRGRLDIDFIFSETPLMLNEAGDGLNRVKEIVKDLSSLAHPQMGRSENKIPTDLNGIIESSLKVFQDEMSGRIRIDKKLNLVSPVRVFPVRMSQVFMNLLSNAIHAIGEKGVIEIRTGEMWGDDLKGHSLKTGAVKNDAAQRQAVIEFADNGVGMNGEILSKIFTPFFTTKPVGQGTGLGLSIAQSIIEMHKGRIDVKSEIGKGSRFIVKLPIDEQGAIQNV